LACHRPASCAAEAVSAGVFDDTCPWHVAAKNKTRISPSLVPIELVLLGQMTTMYVPLRLELD